MTPNKQKQLAESAAEFLGAKNNKLKVIDSGMNCQVYEVHSIVISEYNLFYSCIYAPILMHLGKREMEKREFEWELATIWIKPGIRGYQCEVYGFEKNNYSTEGVCSHENEFIAFWSAVREAVK
ncbi:hypothetical protein LCGC14_2587680 [marine sediment metagenome]|uniref:Uncharacterized protein n=1 Tax=marine sediment metagenome TaxID=412755 RepID=A0A0F9B0J2_9ZZZZ